MPRKTYNVDEFRWRAVRPRQRQWPWGLLSVWAAAMVAAVVWSPAFSGFTGEPGHISQPPAPPSAPSQPRLAAAPKPEAEAVPQLLPVIPAVRAPVRIPSEGPAVIDPEPERKAAEAEEPRHERKPRRSRQTAEARTHRSYERSRTTVGHYRQPSWAASAFGGEFFAGWRF